MIKDKAVKQELRESWNTVLTTKDMISRNIAFSFAGGGFTSDQFRNLTYNLTLLFGFSVVENTLLQLRDEGHFKSPSSQLAKLMEKKQKQNQLG